eukprot:gene1451-1794_t
MLGVLLASSGGLCLGLMVLSRPGAGGWGLLGTTAGAGCVQCAAGGVGWGGGGWRVEGGGEGPGAKRAGGPQFVDPVQQAAAEDATLAKAWALLVKKELPRAAKAAAARRVGVAQEAERLAQGCVKELRIKAGRANREA